MTDAQKQEFQAEAERAEKYAYLDRRLKEYGLISPDSQVFNHNPLNFTQISIEADTYEEQVDLWFDFLHTVQLGFGVLEEEIVLLLDDDTIPGMSWLILLLIDADGDIKECEDCEGTGVIEVTRFSNAVCSCCHGLGYDTKDMLV